MNRFDPIEPELVESAHMAVLHMKEAALNELAQDMDVDPSVLLALSESIPEPEGEEAPPEAIEALKAMLMAHAPGVVDEPLEEESADPEEDEDFDPWASEFLGE